MKHIIIVLVALLTLGVTANAQSYKVEGKTITVEKKAGISQNDVKTEYTITLKDVTYPIYLHKATKGEHQGQWYAYVIRTSKNGNQYNSPVPNAEESYMLGNQIAKEMGLK